MIIESCHIENFGKLSNLDIDFKNGLNVIKQDNGWGKSTLSAFIKVMFYGLFGDTKKDIMVNERKRFAPWQNGTFGGSLTFETKNKRYVITRVFKSKSSEDFFELRDADTGLVSDRFTSNIGEELFHINGESFQRTVFIRQNDAVYKSATDDINQRLGNITDSIDVNRFAQADESLKNAINALSDTRKTGKIYEMKSYASDLRARIVAQNELVDTIRTIEERIRIREKRISELKEKSQNLTSKRSKTTKMQEIIMLKKAYEQIVMECSKKETEVLEKKGFFPNDICTQNEVLELKRSLSQIESANAVLASNALNEVEESVFESLKDTFKNQIPSEPELDSLAQKAEELELLRTNTLVYEYNAVTKEYEIEKEKLRSLKKKRIIGFLITLLFSLSFLGVSIWRYLSKDFDVILIGMLALAMTLLAVSLLIIIPKKRVGRIKQSLQEKKGTLEEINNEITKNEKECESLSKEIEWDLSIYSINCQEKDYRIRINELLGNLRRYEVLSKRNEEVLRAQRTMILYREKLIERLRHFGFEPTTDLAGQVSYIEQRLWEYEDAVRLLDDAMLRKKTFENNNDIVKILEPIDEEYNVSLEKIDEEIATCESIIEGERSSLLIDKRSLSDYMEDYDQWLADNDELRLLEGEIQDKQKLLSNIKATQKFLTRAKENLTSRYTKPLFEGFSKYYEMLTGEAASDYYLDANAIITKSEKGIRRNTESLSNGYQDLCGLCMRLSMADAMYKGEKPMLVMDDPFVNLDDGKILGAKRLIDSVSQEYQIIYFTCRENRL